MVQKLNSLYTILFFSMCMTCFSQENNSLTPKIDNYKTDSSYLHFSKLSGPVAKAQIIALKKGALLVRLKTNANTIQRLKQAGNIDLATQVERETFLNNKAIVRAYLKEFNFCPVYFFYSTYSDSVKQQKLTGIFLDSNLVQSPSIVCSASFYLIAEQGSVYNSSLGFVPLSKAMTAKENGTASKEVAIVIKNRFFIQLHDPFPFFQNGYAIKKFSTYVKKFNASLINFYTKNQNFQPSPEVQSFVY